PDRPSPRTTLAFLAHGPAFFTACDAKEFAHAAIMLHERATAAGARDSHRRFRLRWLSGSLPRRSQARLDAPMSIAIVSFRHNAANEVERKTHRDRFQVIALFISKPRLPAFGRPISAVRAKDQRVRPIALRFDLEDLIARSAQPGKIAVPVTRNP